MGHKDYKKTEPELDYDMIMMWMYWYAVLVHKNQQNDTK